LQIEEAQRTSMQSGLKKANGFSYQGSNRNSNKPLTRNEQIQQEKMIGQANKLKFITFLKCVLDFQLREHEKFLQFFVRRFKEIDTDRDGILNED
jgi:hypothetical protein